MANAHDLRSEPSPQWNNWAQERNFVYPANKCLEWGKQTDPSDLLCSLIYHLVFTVLS